MMTRLAKTVVEPTAKNGFIFTLLGTKWGFLWLWLLIINVAAFLAYGLDKLLAKLKARHEKVPRLPERNLLLLAIVGGGIGVAPVYPIARAYHELGNKVISIVGARSKDLIIWRDKMQAISDELIITTDDGSEGHKGFVTDPLREMLEKGEKIDLVLAIGPVIMMKNVAATTKLFGTKTTVSLNTIMVDGTGMCGGCRVMVGNENKFACVDGPEFDGHLVDFANLMQRQMMYKDQESIEYSCGGHCKCVEE
jgi:ferredoxin--NADP+ reductase